MSQSGSGEDPAPVGYYDLAVQTNGIQAAWHRLKFERIRQRMGRFDRHLDIACGPGTFLGMLDSALTSEPQAGGRSIGVDLEPRQLAYAQARYGDMPGIDGFVAARADDLPFASGSFDLITCIELIEHIPEKSTRCLLNEIRRILVPGGRLILTTPNYRSPWRLLEPMVSWLGPVDYRDEHITHYTRDRLSRLLADTAPSQAAVRSFQLTAPFLAPLGRAVVDRQARLEAQMVRHGGCLLLAEADWP